MRRWTWFAFLAAALFAGCHYTGKNTYEHSGDSYVVVDYQHIDHDDYADKSYTAEHRFHYHR